MKKYIWDFGLLVVAIIWGTGFVSNQIALDHGLMPLQIMAVRFFIASLCMVLIFGKKLQGLNKQVLKAGMLLGVLLFIGFAFQTFGLQHTTPSKNAFLTGTNVVVVPFIGYLIYRRKIDRLGVLGSIITVIGIGVLSLDRNLSINLGDMLTMICAVGFAFHIFYTSEFAKKHDPILLTMIQLFVAFICSFMMMVFQGETSMPVSIEGIGSVIYLGIFSTTICFLLQTICQKKTTETKTAILLSTESIFGTIFSVIILGEMLTVRMIIGCILIFTAIIIAETKLSFLMGKKYSPISELETGE